MKRLLFLLLLPSLAFAQDVRRGASGAGDWVRYNEKGCIGGSTCKQKSVRVALEDRPVIGVRFSAHDQIGTKADGAVRVKIDGDTVRGYIDVPRKGELFTIDVDELRGRALIIEAVNDDEVEISDIAVLYGRENTIRRIPRDRDDDDTWSNRNGGGRGGNSSGGWRSYTRSAGCIGGNECKKNGSRITIALEDAPVLGVRFHAHDSIGTRADGKLTVRIDDARVAWYEDVQRSGKVHEYDVDNVRGSKLVIETANDDEVEIKDIEVLYGRNGGRDGGSRGGNGNGRRWQQREMTHEGGCIGGEECGGRRARIRIPIDGRPVDSLRFYARDDIGTSAGGELRIRIDDEILEYALDISREGRTYNVDCKNIAGDYLIIEPAEDDEVEVKDVRVRFRED